MTKKDLLRVKNLLERTENLPEILYLRAAPIDYELTDADKELLRDTYIKLDDILKEVAAFINVKFPGRQDHIRAWNKIDFDTKLGGFKVLTTNTEHIEIAWKKGLFDLKSLIKSLINEVTLLIDYDEETAFSTPNNEFNWDDYYDNRLEKRADQADFFIDIIIERGLIKLDKQTIRKYFKKWFEQHHNFDLQFKDGDFAIEDNDIQIVPDFDKNNIPEFLKWFENEKNSFEKYLEDQGVNLHNKSNEQIVNNGNLIINKNSNIGEQSMNAGTEQRDSKWTKANVITAIIVGIATITGVLWQLFK